MMDRQENQELQTATEILCEAAEVSRTLRNATALLEKFVRVASGPGHLTLSHWLVMAHMLNKPTRKQVDLKMATGIGPAYLSRLLDELVVQGMLRRQRSPWDRRQILLALTAQGKKMTYQLLTSTNERITQTQRGAMADLGSWLEQFVSSMG
jgi:DNA-binding MarR family transcriptional regulator